MLNSHLQVAPGVQISLSPEDESVLAVVPTSNLISELMELQSWSLLVNRTLGEEIERTTTVVVTKIKIELAESTSSSKTTLEEMRTLEEKIRKVSLEAKEAKRALRAELEAERVGRTKEFAERTKENAGAEEREKALSAEMEKCQ